MRLSKWSTKLTPKTCCAILADRTARSMIGCWHDNVVCLYACLSVHISVTLSIVGKRYILQQKCLNT